MDNEFQPSGLDIHGITQKEKEQTQNHVEEELTQVIMDRIILLTQIIRDNHLRCINY